MRKALTIAGSDSCGGAGIQADIKTMTMNGVYAMSAITALTAQNTTGVTGILEASPEFLRKQLDAVFEDIFPDAVKIGMVSSSELIGVIADCLTEYKAVNIVVDPVMVATSGARLIEDTAIDTLKARLLPLAAVITPNIPEAEILADMTIRTEADMEKVVGKFDAYVISTGTPTARDLKIPGRELKGVHLALELLSQQNRVLAGMEFSKEERVTAKGKNVLVIGGGDTGSDCIGTSHRQGCKSVTQIEIMPKPVEGPEDPQNPWPNWPRTLKTTSSHEEGCVRRWNINSLEFLGENGKLTGVRVQPIDWKPNPEGGRPIMVEAGEPEIIKAEIVFLAMGFLKPQQPEFPSNVFVCGDAANGASLVVRAMASGRDAAKKVDAYLK